jgi:hypothetical protein
LHFKSFLLVNALPIAGKSNTSGAHDPSFPTSRTFQAV